MVKNTSRSHLVAAHVFSFCRMDKLVSIHRSTQFCAHASSDLLLGCWSDLAGDALLPADFVQVVHMARGVGLLAVDMIEKRG